MFGFKFIKFDAMTYVLQYKNGGIKREGRGLSFWYYRPTTSIVAIPMGSDDAPFIFEDSTKDFQTVTVQGEITYQITDPKRLADLLDFTVDTKGKRISSNYEKLSQRIVNEAQAAASVFLGDNSLRGAMAGSKVLEKAILAQLQNSEAIQSIGIKPLSVIILSVKPTPEMARALEAETREALQVESDQAIYKRRNFAVEQERAIKESELNTEIAIEEKKKQIADKKMEAEIKKAENNRELREMKITADIVIEENRTKLIELESENKRKAADAEAYRMEKMLGLYKGMDWKTIMALNGESDPKLNVALAFRELAENSGNIQNLNISPDLLSNLIK
jgi:regulator of protease activity HflC (stomatin/prohibitin superfamily)